jgi:hypothetical protein
VSTDDRIRAATRATADTVHDIGPLALPDDSPARQRRLSQRRLSQRRLRQHQLRHAWGGWLIPVAAAVAVIVFAAVLVAVRDLPGFGHAADGTQVTTTGGGGASLPTYGAVLTGHTAKLPPDGPPGDTVANSVDVFNTRTGQHLVTVPPSAYQSFTAVSAAADDRTFALAALNLEPQSIPGSQSKQEVWSFYLLHIDPGRPAAAKVLPLSIPEQPQGAVIAGFALSPDGKTLAVQEWCTQAPCRGSGGTLKLYSVATGKVLRDWTWGTTTDPLPSYGGTGGLSENRVGLTWLAGGRRLAFTYFAHGQASAVWTLDSTSPSGSLAASGIHVFTLPQACAEAILTPDGQTVICGTQPPAVGPLCGPALKETLEIDAYSLVTRKREAVLYRHADGCTIVGPGALGWVGAENLVVAMVGDISYKPTVGGALEIDTYVNVGVVTHGTLTPLLPAAPTTGYAQGPGAIAF